MKPRPLHSAHGNIHWVIIVGLFIIAVILGVSMMWQKQELRDIKRSLTVASAPTALPEQKYDVINHESFRYGDSDVATAFYVIEQRCYGTTKYINPESGFGNKSYCLGRNVLAIRPFTDDRIISDVTIQGDRDLNSAPILRKLDWINEEKLAIDYGGDACAISADCGVGGPQRFVTMVLNKKTMTATNVRAYPSSGDLIWNRVGTKTVVLPVTCGGAGCTTDVLKGYDLTNDRMKTLTKEKASEAKDAVDINGDKIAHWGWIHWTDDNTVEAEIVQPDGSKKSLTIKF